MKNTAGYVLTVVVHGPEVSEPAGVTCALLIDLIKVDPPVGMDLAELPDLFLLEEAPEVAVHLCQDMLGSGFVVRVDVPPDAPVAAAFPIVVRTSSDLTSVMDRLRGHAKDRLLYPLAFWALPRPRERELGRTVDAFYALGRDSSLFTEALAAGAMRLAAFPSSLTLSLHCSELSLGQDWVRHAMTRSKPETR